MQKKSILITGCSSGIGYATAKILHKRGWKVFATCRKQKDCNKLKNEGIESFLLDYQKEKTIKTALQSCLEVTGGTLDAIFNNGAFATPGALEDISTGALKDIFQTNVFGYHELIRLSIPIMRDQGYGRIVNCSSVLGLVALPFRGAYNSTKFAIEGLSDTLRVELINTNIKVILIEPGPITSLIRKNSIPKFEKWVKWEQSYRTDDYRKFLIPRLYKENGLDSFELPANAVSKKVIHAIESAKPKTRYFVTTPTYFMYYMKKILPTKWLDLLISKI
jgi:NAD(P)-dependent dehydrogenase (short-subunit alcohol dehydrogenase family)